MKLATTNFVATTVVAGKQSNLAAVSDVFWKSIDDAFLFRSRGEFLADVGKDKEKVNTYDLRCRGEGDGMNLADISNDQWTIILKRLALHADNKLRRLIWRGVSGRQGGTPSGGIQAEDLAAEAIIDLLDGRRVWDASRNPDLIDWLRDVIDSKVSHLVEGKENRVMRRFFAEMNEADVTAVSRGRIGTEQPPDESLAEAEEIARLCDSIRVEFAGDDVATRLFSCCIDGVSKPSEVAMILQLPVQTIYDAQKRLRRGVERILTNRRRTG